MEFTRPLLVLAMVFGLCQVTVPANAMDESRTAGRIVTANPDSPFKTVSGPKWRKALPRMWDPKHEHPQMWKGMEWDTSKWTEARWQPQRTLQRFYDKRIFERQYVNGDGGLVIDVGPNFYKLSDLDRRRTLQLVAEYFKVFESGAAGFHLHDWYTHNHIGMFTAKGMQLD